MHYTLKTMLDLISRYYQNLTTNDQAGTPISCLQKILKIFKISFSFSTEAALSFVKAFAFYLKYVFSKVFLH